ncbi:RHS repeat-associated core domain-containing protein [Streptomyces sp. T1317-0309]|nr:RHS repeat-associated core domain-containing protein [Streptomyces sp. T1317-0309]
MELSEPGTTGSTATAYSYDAEGNQTKAGADTFAYDLAGQISAATIGGNSYTYTHDATGNQLTTSKSGTLQGRLDWDLNASVPQLATEYDSAGAIKQSYRHDPLGQPAAIETGSGAVFYYHHDTQGSPVDVTGSTGTLYQRWAYDPYGTRTLSTVTSGAPASTPGYTGARYETTTGNLDLHARQYTASSGRFTSTDPVSPDRNSAYTSAYAYADNAPTLYTDPSGMCSIITQLKDVFTGNWGWNNNCAEEDRETATKPPAVQAVKNLSDNATASLINTTGQASLGLLDGLTFGTFSYLSGAQVTCPSAYNYGLYASIVPFPIEGGESAAGANAFRALRVGEDAAAGLVRAGADASVEPWAHVMGAENSPWISLTRDPEVMYNIYGEGSGVAGRGAHGYIAVDLTKVTSEVFDAAHHLPVPEHIKMLGLELGETAFRDKEVLVKMVLNGEAVVRYWPAGTSLEQIMRDLGRR